MNKIYWLETRRAFLFEGIVEIEGTVTSKARNLSDEKLKKNGFSLFVKKTNKVLYECIRILIFHFVPIIKT